MASEIYASAAFEAGEAETAAAIFYQGQAKIPYDIPCTTYNWLSLYLREEPTIFSHLKEEKLYGWTDLQADLGGLSGLLLGLSLHGGIQFVIGSARRLFS